MIRSSLANLVGRTGNPLMAGLILAALAWPAPSVRADDEFSAIEHTRQTIYHSPQKPGFTSWVGAWTMPDGSLMISFTQAIGPVDGRPQAPPEVQHKLTWPPAGHPGYDMTGLEMSNVYLRSTDTGKTWKQVSADAFKTCMNGVTNEALTALADGSVLRGVFGFYLPYNPDVATSGIHSTSDAGQTWHPLDVPGTAYYPRSVQTKDGRIFVFGHVGGDDAYGKVDQSIVMDSFRLKTKKVNP